MLKFSGNYQEFGEFLGRRHEEYRHDFATQIDENVYRRQRKVYEKYYPEIFEQIKGQAAATSRSEKQILWDEVGVSVMTYKNSLKRQPRGCTIFSVRQGKEIFVGRNYDWLPRTRMIFEKCQVCLENRHAYFAFSDRGTWPGHLGRKDWDYFIEDAVNDQGLYLGLTFAHIDKWNYGLRSSHFIRLAAEKCSTVEDVLKLVKKVPLCHPQNFLVADKLGNSVIIEHYARDYEIIRPDARGILIKTNHSLSPKTIPIDHVRLNHPKADTFLRYAEAEQLITDQLGEPKFQFTDLWRILRQSHYVYNDSTIWSLALELSSERYNLYYDTAMGQKQEKFGFKHGN